VANDKVHTCAAGGVDDRGAFLQGQRHRFLDEQMFAMLSGERRMPGVPLVRRRHVNHLDGRINTKFFNCCVSVSGKFLGKTLSCLGARISRRHQADARVGLKGRQHHGKCASKSGDADAQFTFARSAQAPTLDKITDILYSDLRYLRKSARQDFATAPEEAPP